MRSASSSPSCSSRPRRSPRSTRRGPRRGPATCWRWPRRPGARSTCSSTPSPWPATSGRRPPSPRCRASTTGCPAPRSAARRGPVPSAPAAARGPGSCGPAAANRSSSGSSTRSTSGTWSWSTSWSAPRRRSARSSSVPVTCSTPCRRRTPGSSPRPTRRRPWPTGASPPCGRPIVPYCRRWPTAGCCSGDWPDSPRSTSSRRCSWRTT